MLKRTTSLFTAALLCSLTVFSSNGLAQENKETKKPDAPSAQAPARNRVTPEQRVDRMATRLGLNEEQKTKLKGALESETKAIRELRDDTSVSAEDRRAKMREIRKQTTEKINAFLTDEQKKKYTEMQNQMRQPGERGDRSGNRPNRNPRQ